MILPPSQPSLPTQPAVIVLIQIHLKDSLTISREMPLLWVLALKHILNTMVLKLNTTLVLKLNTLVLRSCDS